MSPPRWVWMVVFVCFVFVAAVGAGTASSEYTLQPDNEIQTPDRNITYDGTELAVSSIGTVDHENTITADISGPGYPLEVQVRSATNPGPLIESETRDSAGEVSFNTDGTLDPGTYMLLLSRYTYERAVPVVVSGYDMTAEATIEEETDELTISTTATPTASSGEPNTVRAVVWDGESQQDTALTQQADGEYQSQVSVSELDDDYDVYVTALGEETLYERSENEILAISEATIQEESNVDDDSDEGDDSENNDGVEGFVNGSTGAENSSEDETSVEPPNDNTTNDSSSTDDTDVIQPTDDEDTGTSSDDKDTGTSSDDKDTGTSSDDEDTTDSQFEDETPLSPSLAIIALLNSAIVLALRANSRSNAGSESRKR